MDKVIKNFQNISYGPAPEDSKEVNSWIKNLKNTNNHFINGKFVKSSSSKKLNIINPSTNKKIATLSVASKKDVNAAVSAAKKAHVKWSKLSSFDRSKYLYALARLIQKNSRFISVLETIDNGKPIRETRDIDIPLVARHFYYHAGWAARNTNNSDNSIGVVGQIIPWNFPLLMLAWKIAPAIALGNTVVLKPAEYTSLTALYFAELCEKAKIPQGVINIITGDGSTGEHITSHKDIKKIAFTGSTEVGKKIIQTNTNPDKKMTMELGGKSPFIVFEDADLDSAVEGVVDAIWFNQGQVCCALSRLLVQKSIEKKFIQKLKKSSLSNGTEVLSAILTIYFISIFLYSNLSNFIDEIPEINVALEKKIERYSEKNLYGLEDVIFDTDIFSSIASPSNIETFVISILGSLGGFMTTMSTVLVFLLFIILEEETLASRFDAAFPNSYGKAKTIVSGAFESITAYVVSKVTCSAGQAAVMTLILSPWGFDIPGWFLFGVLCFLLDFIPIIGALFATIPPVIISFIVLEPSSAVIMLILLIANQQMIGTLIEANISGAKLVISPIIQQQTVS